LRKLSSKIFNKGLVNLALVAEIRKQMVDGAYHGVKTDTGVKSSPWGAAQAE
jgi:hypothetical protein